MLRWRRPIASLIKSFYTTAVRNILEIKQFYILKNTGLYIIVISLLHFKLTL